MAKTVHFLLVYSFEAGRLVHQDEFIDRNKAIRAYDEAERRYSTEDEYEIVLVGADSIETIMQTHGHYFTAPSESSVFSQFLMEPVS